jgi:hypothetical protein
MQIRSLLNQIGGRNAITKWSWVLTIPLAMIVSSTYQGLPTFKEVMTWQSIVLAVHVVLGLLMFVGYKFLLPNIYRKPRPLLALSFFALLGTIRGLLLQFAQEQVGISAGIFAERMAVNVIGAVVFLSAIAIVVDDFRTDESIVKRLEQAKQTLDGVRKQELSILKSTEIDLLSGVRQKIEESLQQETKYANVPKTDLSNFVRDLSHELYSKKSNLHLSQFQNQNVNHKLSIREAFVSIKAPQPLVVAVLVELTLLPPVLARFGIVIALANALFGGMLLFLGASILRKLPIKNFSPLFQFIWILLILPTIGFVATLITGVAISSLRQTFPAGLIGTSLGITAAGIAVSLQSSIQAGRTRRQLSMSEAVTNAARALENLNREIDNRNLSVSKFLHGTIQSELIAAFIREEDPSKAVEKLSNYIQGYENTGKTDAEVTFQEVIKAWSGVLECSVDIDSKAWDLLRDDLRRSELLIDVVSEGLTNAVRHSSNREVAIAISLHGGVIKVRITSKGEVKPRVDGGIGLSHLQNRGLSVRLLSEGDSVVLVTNF